MHWVNAQHGNKGKKGTATRRETKRMKKRERRREIKTLKNWKEKSERCNEQWTWWSKQWEYTHTHNARHEKIEALWMVLIANAAPGASGYCIYIYAMHFSISIFMGLKKRDTNNELTIRLIRSHQQVVTKAELYGNWAVVGRMVGWLARWLAEWIASFSFMFFCILKN